MFLVHLWWWVERFTGASNTSGVAYGVWSGFGSDLAEFAIIGSILGLYKHHNCAVPHCPRWAHERYHVEGTHLKTCHKHATIEWHDKLRAQYKLDFPEQHKLLKSKES